MCTQSNIILFYVIFHCVTKFKTDVNVHYISYRNSSKYNKYENNNVHSGNITLH